MIHILTSKFLSCCVILTAVSAFSACSSIPLSTAWKLRDFKATDFTSTDPGQLSTAVLAPAKFKLAETAGSISITLHPQSDKAETSNYLMQLHKIDSREQIDGLDKAGAGKQWHILELTDAGIAELDRLQNELAEHAPVNHYYAKTEVNVLLKLSGGGSPIEQVTLTIGLKLSDSEGYFTLLRNATISNSAADGLD